MKLTLPALLLAALALLGVTACGDDSPNTSGDSNTSDTDDESPAPAPS